jgi:hypothetical protein
MAAIQRGATSGSYRYELQSKYPGGQTVRLSGIFVPPDKAHLIFHNGHEFIWSDGRKWMKTPSDGEWHALPVAEPTTYLGTLDPDRIGSVRCLGEVIEDSRAQLAYEYEVFPGKPGQFPKAFELTEVTRQISRRLPARYRPKAWSMLVPGSPRSGPAPDHPTICPPGLPVGQQHRARPTQVRDPFDGAHQGHTDLPAHGQYQGGPAAVGPHEDRKHGPLLGVEVDDALEIAEKIEV